MKFDFNFEKFGIETRVLFKRKSERRIQALANDLPRFLGTEVVNYMHTGMEQRFLSQGTFWGDERWAGLDAVYKHSKEKQSSPNKNVIGRLHDSLFDAVTGHGPGMAIDVQTLGLSSSVSFSLLENELPHAHMFDQGDSEYSDRTQPARPIFPTGYGHYAFIDGLEPVIADWARRRIKKEK